MNRSYRSAGAIGRLVDTRSGGSTASVVLASPEGQWLDLRGDDCTPYGPPVAGVRDGRHDFDWELGTWQTQLRVLRAPLTGSTEWAEYTGTSVVRPVLGGLANLVELDAEGEAGRIQGINLRLYDPVRGRWSLNFASGRDGALSPPVIGGFDGGRGEFHGLEVIAGKPIFVLFTISDISAAACRFEQAFSEDGGRTWELNWVAIDTRRPDTEEGGTPPR